jgi:hypothetical protein
MKKSMKLDPETMIKFKELYKEEFGEELSDDAAFEKFLRLVNALRVIVYGRLDITEESGNLGPKSGS